MEIIDVIGLADAKCPYFTADTTGAVDNIALTTAGGLGYNTLQNAGGATKFKKGDNFAIISAGVRLPEGFQLCQTNKPLILELLTALSIKGVAGGLQYFPDVLSSNGLINLPLDNFELSIDVFCDVTKQAAALAPHALLNEDFYLQAFTIQSDISMLAVPAAFNGKKFFCYPFFKILHNFQMF